MVNQRHETVEYLLEGLPRLAGHIPLSTFLVQLRTLYEALLFTDRLISRQPEATARYRIVELRQASPASVTIAAIPKRRDLDYSSEILDGLVGALDQIEETGQPPAWADRVLLEKLHKLNSPVGTRLRSAKIRRNHRTVGLSRELGAKINVILAPAETFMGSIKGKLEWINLHGEVNTFRIYPVAGPARVACSFPPDLRDRAIEGVGKNVIVHGELKYKANAPFPEEIDVTEIEVLPPDDELPTLSELRGVAPNATGGLSSVEFVRQIRDEWE